MTPDDHRNIAHMLLCIRDRTPDPDDARVLGDAADALRQCAEQQPVGWMKEGWGPDCGPYVEFYRDDEMGWRDRKEWKPLYAAPATTEAQREPLSDEQIDAALQTDPAATVLELMDGEMTVGEFKLALRRLARTVERAHGIGGSDAGTD